MTLQVFGCVRVTPRCRAIEVQNPDGVALEVSVFSTDDEAVGVDGDGDATPLPAHGTVTIPWTASTAWVLAVPTGAWDDLAQRFFSLASPLSDRGEPATTKVPQNC